MFPILLTLFFDCRARLCAKLALPMQGGGCYPTRQVGSAAHRGHWRCHRHVSIHAASLWSPVADSCRSRQGSGLATNPTPSANRSNKQRSLRVNEAMGWLGKDLWVFWIQPQSISNESMLLRLLRQLAMPPLVKRTDAVVHCTSNQLMASLPRSHKTRRCSSGPLPLLGHSINCTVRICGCGLCRPCI